MLSPITDKATRTIRLLMVVGLLVVSQVAALAHEGCTLGHHWECSDYVFEMRLQILVMAAVAVGWAVWGWMRSPVARRARK